MAISAARKKRLREMSLDILVRNRRHVDGYQYTVPSPKSYPFQWLWDSCFHAIALSYFNPEDAKKELRAVVSQQFENGMLPHMIYRGDGRSMKLGDGFVTIDWGKASTSSITQPPIIAEAVWRIFCADGDSAFLKEMYPSMKAFFEYLLSARDPRGNHLAGVINPDESGEDNSPRFDGVLGLPPVQTLQENFASRLKLVEELKKGHFDVPFMKQYFWVKDVPFNAMLVENLAVLARIAERIGGHEDATRFAEESRLVSEAMRERMFDGEFFWPTYGEGYFKIKLKTWAVFAPLYAGLLSEDEAARLVEDHLLNPNEFLSTFMLPTVAMNEFAYDPEGFWRGPVWMAVNWFVYRGLRRYKFHNLANTIREMSAELLEKSGFREYYHPETGTGLGAHDFTWGALIVDMLADAED
jgi:glycogen debranching enzyme